MHWSRARVVALLLAGSLSAGASGALAQSPSPSMSTVPVPEAAVVPTPAEQCELSPNAVAAEDFDQIVGRFQSSIDEARAAYETAEADDGARAESLRAHDRVVQFLIARMATVEFPGPARRLAEDLRTTALEEGAQARALSETDPAGVDALTRIGLPRTQAAISALREALGPADACIVGETLQGVEALIAGPHPTLDEAGVVGQYFASACSLPLATYRDRYIKPPKGWPGTLSRRDRVLDREVGCLAALMEAWVAYRAMGPDEVPEGAFAEVAALYGAAIDRTGRAGKQYIDGALRTYERDLAMGTRAKKAKRSLRDLSREPTRRVSTSGLHRLLHDVYGDSVALVNPPPRRGFADGRAVTWHPFEQDATASLPALCRHDPFYHSCDAAVADTWLLYEATGDERWYRLASGLRSLRIEQGPAANPFSDKRVACYLKKNPTQC